MWKRLVCLLLLAGFAVASVPAVSATYYVAPSGTAALSTRQARPGSLASATANAPSGSTVILADGTYDGTPAGFTVVHADVTFRALHWHAAIIVDTTGPGLWDSGTAPGNVCQGMVFGPCLTPYKGMRWSGGGGDYCKFLDCVFTKNDGVGFGNYGLVERCVFTDQWSNSFDVNGVTGFTMRDCIARRGNRANGDSDSIGNKEDSAKNLTFDGLIAYDNEGNALWFDTHNQGWTVENCTLFANHGGNNWYTLVLDGANSTTSVYNYSPVAWGSGQDHEHVPVGAPIMGLSGTPANFHAASRVTKVDVVSDGKTPPTYKYTFTISPALPVVPVAGDVFAVQQESVADAYGFTTEANPNGVFVDNVTYSNTSGGYYDHASGNGYQVAHGGLTIAHNLFVDDGADIFFGSDHNVGNYDRGLAAADISYNRFRFDPGKTLAFASWGNGLKGYPKAYGIVFDHNTYDAENGKPGWAVWWGNPVGKQIANNLADLQDPGRFDQDQHSTQAPVEFRGTPVRTYVFPAADDTRWADICFPANVYSQTGSIRQVDDDETPYIEDAVAGKRAGDKIVLTVFGHTPIDGAGPFTCDVFDYSGCWMKLTIPTRAAAKVLDAKVPGYAVLAPCHIPATLTCNPSVDPYRLTAVFSGSTATGRAAR